MKTTPAATSFYLAAAAAVVVSCSTSTGGGDVDPLVELHNRPSAEAAMANFAAMDAEMRTAITAIAPSVRWKMDLAASSSACREPFTKLGGTSFGLPLWGASGGIPEEVWTAAASAVRKIAARYGLSNVTTVVDRPGDHQVRFSSPADGTYTDLGTWMDASIGTTTGCFLPQVSREPAPPTSPPTTR